MDFRLLALIFHKICSLQIFPKGISSFPTACPPDESGVSSEKTCLVEIPREEIDLPAPPYPHPFTLFYKERNWRMPLE